MRTSERQKQQIHSRSTNGPAAIGVLILGAFCLGAALTAAGNTSTTFLLGSGALTLLILSGLLAFALEIPLIRLLRAAFIGSFFFKGDFALFKINEIEDPSGLNISLTIIFALTLLIYDKYFDHNNERVIPLNFFLFLTAILVTSAVSVIYAGATLLGGFSLLSVACSILIAYATASHFGRRDRLIQLVVLIAAGLLFTGTTALTQYTINFPTELPNFGTGTEDELLGTQSELFSRVPSFLRTPTEMAWVVSCLVPVVLAPLICRVKSIEPWMKLVLVAGGVAGIAAVILSLARGSWLGLFGVLILVIALGWYKLSTFEKSRHFSSFLVAILVCGAILTPFTPRIYERLTADDEGSALIRLPLMENAMLMIGDNALVGVGLNGYRTHMTKYDETGIFVSQVFPNPVHNVFAHITAEIGILGGVIFCLLIIFSMYESFLSFGSDDRLVAALGLGLGLAMIAFVVSGLKEPGSLGSVRPPVRIWFLILGITLAVTQVRKRQLLNY